MTEVNGQVDRDEPARRIAGVMKDRGLSQTRLARQIHCNQATLSRLINGAAHPGSPTTLARIVESLDLLEREPEALPPEDLSLGQVLFLVDPARGIMAIGRELGLRLDVFDRSCESFVFQARETLVEILEPMEPPP